jgi:hypothetical protein
MITFFAVQGNNMEQTATTVKRPYVKLPPKGTPEYTAEVARRQAERYKLKKETASEPRDPGSEPPLPANLPIVYQTPEDLVGVLGESVTLPAEWTTWPMYHVRRQKDLSVTTMKQYKTYHSKLPDKDIYDVVRFIVGHDAATQNQFAKSGLSYVSQQLYDMIYVGNARIRLAKSPQYKKLLHQMMVYSELNKRTKKVSYETHICQEASADRHANTVEWPVWSKKARQFVSRVVTMKEPTERDKKEAMIVAVYSMIPPVRLDWNDVIVERVKKVDAVKGEKGKNILYVSAPASVMTWGEFKNVASFGTSVPLIQPIPAPLHRVFRKLLPAGDSTPFKVPNFSTYLTDLAETITGKRFTNRLMRSSYIRQWHMDNSAEVVDVKKTRAMMKLMHQTNLEVHLAYQKFKDITPEMAE